MMPISSYRELIRELKWDEDKRENERWYIFLVMNPKNQTNAGIDIIRNLSYLDTRTGNVTFFIPGFSNLNEGIVPYPARNGSIIHEDPAFGTLYFDQSGFLDTIEWLERGSGHKYTYSEDLDLVIVKYRPRHSDNCDDRSYERNFDLKNMIAYNLDRMKREGINTLRMITECRNIISASKSEEEVRYRLDRFAWDTTAWDRSCSHDRTPIHKQINVFVAGSKTLTQERDAVRSALSMISGSSSNGYTFNVKTYENFERSLTVEGRQQEYNRFISEDADYAIFILDKTVGGITLEEFGEAYNAYKRNSKPEIYVYSHLRNNRKGLFGLWRPFRQSEKVNEVKSYLAEIGQYYIEYQDLKDLKDHIVSDFRKYGI